MSIRDLQGKRPWQFPNENHPETTQNARRVIILAFWKKDRLGKVYSCICDVSDSLQWAYCVHLFTNNYGGITRIWRVLPQYCSTPISSNHLGNQSHKAITPLHCVQAEFSQKFVVYGNQLLGSIHVHEMDSFQISFPYDQEVNRMCFLITRSRAR